MRQKTYYDLLESAQYADLATITEAYLRISQALALNDSPEARLQLEELRQAYEVLSNPLRRSGYDKSLVLLDAQASHTGMPLHLEVALEPNKSSPFRILLTIIAGVMVIGLVIQIGAMLFAYQRTRAFTGNRENSPAAEKVYLQEVYQTYGIRAASRAEADLALAEMHRKEQATREDEQKKRQLEEEERKQNDFLEQSRREATANSEKLWREEQEIDRRKKEELQREEEREEAKKAEEMERMQRAINDLRSGSSRDY